MPLSDLTNTKWAFNFYDGVDLNNDVSFSVNFNANKVSYISLSVSNSELIYETSSGPVSIGAINPSTGFFAGQVQNSVIVITGGTDVTNSNLITWLETNAKQIIVEDLTNTKWILNSAYKNLAHSLNLSPVPLTFTSNSEDFRYLKLSATTLGYGISAQNITTVYQNNVWVNTNYRLVNITGGTVSTADTLLAWFTWNATPIQVADLSGTEWEMNSSLLITTQDNATYNINGDGHFLNNQGSFNGSFTSIQLLKSTDPNASVLYCNNTPVYFASWNGNEPFTMSFSSNAGTDATNPNLIAWLTQNATYQAPVVGNAYEITHSLTNLTHGNVSFTITPDAGYSLPSSVTVTNGTLVSYDSSTGVVVVSGDNAEISVSCEVASVGYSGNIDTYQVSSPSSINTKIKFDTPPADDNDYDAAVGSTGTMTGMSSYSNKTKIYVWGSANNGVIINNVSTNGGTIGYLSSVGITLTGNYTIYLVYNAGGGGDR